MQLPILTLLLFSLLSSGCISIANNGLTFHLPHKKTIQEKRANVEDTGQKHVGNDLQQQRSSLPQPIVLPLAQKLNEDHWRANPIYPDPVTDYLSVRDLKSTPLFRWQHQQFTGTPFSTASVTTAMVSVPEVSTDKETANQFAETQQTIDSATEQLRLRSQDQILQKNSKLLSQLQHLTKQDGLAGWNASIHLARHAPDSRNPVLLSRLQEIALQEIQYDTQTGKRSKKTLIKKLPEVQQAKENKKRLSDAMRAAAAEAWCYMLAAQAGEPEELFADAGRALQNQQIPVAVRIELLRGIARRVKPRQIPTLSNHFAESELQHRLLSPITIAAIDACICYAITHPQSTNRSQSASTNHVVSFDAQSLDPSKTFPESIWQVRWHQDRQAVNRLGLWLALTNQPVAQSYLTTSLNHLEPSVQYHAIRNLGYLNSESALEKLQDIVETRPGIPRAIALNAIGSRNEKLIYQHQNDDSAVVRTAIAHFAGENHSANASKFLQQLAQDDDLKVQQAAVAAVNSWNHEAAFPVLATAFTSGGIPTRNLTRKKLEQRFDIVLAAMEEEIEQRQQIINTISQKFRLASRAYHSGALKTEPQQHGTLEDQKQNEQQLNQLLTKLAQAQSTSWKRDRLLEDIKQVVEQSPEVLDTVLNEFGITELEQQITSLSSSGLRSFENVSHLQDKQLMKRRTAAKGIAMQAKKKTLPDWKLRLIAKALSLEQDLQICRNFMNTVSEDTTPAAIAVARNSLLHTWPDVRILGCQYAQKHRLPQLAPFLLPLLQSRNASVQQAAISACGYCQNPVVIDGIGNASTSQQRSGLRSLLGTLNHENELLVIAGLARLGDEQGQAELLKLSYASDAKTRQQVVRIMGELQDQKMVQHLIRIGWTERAPHIRIEVLNSLKKIVPESQRPKSQPADTPKIQMELWNDWFIKNKQKNPARTF